MCASAIVLLAGLTACGSDRSTPARVLPPAHHASTAPSPSARPLSDLRAARRIVDDLHAVALTRPFAQQDPHTFDPTILDVAITGHLVTLYAQSPDQAGVAGSTDGGADWQRVRAR